MARGEYDPVRAARAERRLAAVTDAELVADIRAAAVLLGEVVEVWRRSPQWTGGRADQAVYESARAVPAAAEHLDGKASVDAAVDAVTPALRIAWPTLPPLAGAAGVAVDQLRDAAMHRPGMVRQCRRWVANPLPPDSPWRRLLPSEPLPPRSPTPAEVVAWGLWLHVSTGLLPALEVGELRPGEVAEELDVALEVARAGERGWGQAGRRFRTAMEAVAALVAVDAAGPAAGLLRHAVGRFHAVAGRMLASDDPVPGNTVR